MLELLATKFTRADATRLLASLVLAFLLWGWVTNLQDPETTRVFRNVPIEIGSLPGTLQVVTSLPSVTITVSGPESVIDEIREEDVEAHLDIEGIDAPGSYTAAVVAELPQGVRNHRIEPSEIQIDVEDTVSRQVELTVERPDLTGDPRQVGSVSPAVSEVTVTGPRSVVARVDRVVLPIDLGDRTSDFRGEFVPVPQDAAGESVPEATVRPETVSATVRVSARGRSVAVLAQVVGEPAQGYAIGDRTVNPPIVLVDGPDEALADLIFVATEPVDISGVTETVSERVPLEPLPEGVRIVEPIAATVDVVVGIRERGTTQPLSDLQPTFTGLAPDLQAVANPSDVDVVVIATEQQLGQMRAGDIKVLIDLEGLGPGTHRLTPAVSVPPNVQWVRTEPATVEVEITERPAATPDASSEPGA